MKRLAILFCLVGLASCKPKAADDAYLDPATADPEHYKVELQNDFVRVLRENLAAGVQGKMHSHPSRVSVYLRDTEVLLTPRDGAPVEVTEKAGTAAWGDPVTHAGFAKSDVENISNRARGPERRPDPASRRRCHPRRSRAPRRRARERPGAGAEADLSSGLDLAAARAPSRCQRPSHELAPAEHRLERQLPGDGGERGRRSLVGRSSRPYDGESDGSGRRHDPGRDEAKAGRQIAHRFT